MGVIPDQFWRLGGAKEDGRPEQLEVESCAHKLNRRG